MCREDEEPGAETPPEQAVDTALFCMGLFSMKLLCQQPKPGPTQEARTAAETRAATRARKHVLGPHPGRRLGKGSGSGRRGHS